MSGELALVLHTHMPYVEGFGTWPFGEEWLWEAIATSYLPLLDVLGDEPGPVTLSVTPVLADQLEAPGALERCAAFIGPFRAETHALDAAEATEPGVRTALEGSAARYARAAARLAALGGDLLGALAPHAAWTSSATHAVLPLLATDGGIRLQLEAGIGAHRRRFGAWDGGFWLPECAHAPWLDPLLAEAGVRAVCVDLTDVLGPGTPEQLRPLRSPAGPLLVPVDRELIELVWDPAGYPADPRYRDYYGLTTHDHRAWANDGTAYDADRAAAAVEEHAADFVARAGERLADGGLAVCALDTELLGHWWHEGPAWLAAVLAAAGREGLELTRLDHALRAHADGVGGSHREAAPAPEALPPTTWGRPRDLSTWSGPRVADLAWAARAAELAVVRAGHDLEADAARELLALQASDWAFLASAGLAGPYPRERAEGHRARLAARLAGEPGHAAALRHLAPGAGVAPLLA
jgi:1,4-alpha-glucan branching enzyme